MKQCEICAAWFDDFGLGCDTCADCLADQESNHYSQLIEEALEREKR